MKILCVIPARFSSTRLPGKPLADICGKPMIYHTFKAARQVRDFSEIIVATDSKQILQVCSDFGIPALLTSENCEEHISRVWEVARQKEADLYVCINGDEPLIEPEAIRKVLSFAKAKKRFFVGAYRILNSASKVIDSSNIKVVTNTQNRAIFMSRMPLPMPKNSLDYPYKKYVGIECFSKESLEFFVNTPPGALELTCDIDHLRFLEHFRELYFVEVESKSLSVDTQKDLEAVREIFKSKGVKND
ncbi:MAG: 3-deoxy-manno-octulosonate cytidylyltransferase [Helicobacter sp.]|nr:3-deoxy-manno-octulosonate cytidylyltransferase [Helicobacter sp.]